MLDCCSRASSGCRAHNCSEVQFLSNVQHSICVFSMLCKLLTCTHAQHACQKGCCKERKPRHGCHKKLSGSLPRHDAGRRGRPDRVVEVQAVESGIQLWIAMLDLGDLSLTRNSQVSLSNATSTAQLADDVEPALQTEIRPANAERRLESSCHS